MVKDNTDVSNTSGILYIVSFDYLNYINVISSLKINSTIFYSGWEKGKI